LQLTTVAAAQELKEKIETPLMLAWWDWGMSACPSPSNLLAPVSRNLAPGEIVTLLGAGIDLASSVLSDGTPVMQVTQVCGRYSTGDLHAGRKRR